MACVTDSECPICMEPFTDPKLLPCSHTFCASCLVRHGSCRPGDYIDCPKCRQRFPIPHGGLLSLPNDLSKLIMCASVKKARLQSHCNACGLRDSLTRVYCIDCRQSLCDSCTEIHNHDNTLMIQELTCCKLHTNEFAVYFCRDCHLLICTKCVKSSVHSAHEYDDVVSAARSEIDQLQDDARKVDHLLSCQQQQFDMINEEKSMFLDCLNHAEREIEAATEEVIRRINQHRLNVLDELEIKKQTRLKELENFRQDLLLQYGNMRSYVDLVAKLTQDNNTADVLTHVKTLRDSVKQFSQLRALPPGQKLVFIPTDNKVITSATEENLIGKLHTLTETKSEPLRTYDMAMYRKTHCHFRTMPVEKLKACTRNLETIRGDVKVCGIAVLNDNIYVSRQQCCVIDVYDANRVIHRKSRALTVDELTDPTDMVACSELHSLYLCAQDDQKLFKMSNSEVFCFRQVDDRPYRLSVNCSQHLIVLYREALKVKIYAADDRELWQIELPSFISLPTFVVQFGCSHFIVCDNNVEMIDIDSNGMKLRKYKLTCRSHSVVRPVHIVEASKDEYLIVDEHNSRIVCVNNETLKCEEILNQTHDLEKPCGLCVDVERERLLVGLSDGSVKVFDNTCIVM